MGKSQGSSGADTPARIESADNGQAAVIAFLSDPGSYPSGVESVSRVETHAAIVFLADDRAYKLKRAVKLPYLDFSTVERRRAVIQRELEINSKISPELYLAAVAITLAPGADRLELAGPGEAIDWLLVMRRFGDDALLHTSASKGYLDRELVVDLATTVEHFHHLAAPVTMAAFARTLDTIVASLEAVLCGTDAEAKGLRLTPAVERIGQELEARRASIEEREREGFVRRCHGDLHLKNIVLWDGKPRLFDAIEFDDRLATIDVLYDLAFLLMDLWRCGLKPEANAILNHYFRSAAISEIQGLSLLPLYMSLRSAIRVMTGLHALAVRETRGGVDSSMGEIESYAKFTRKLLAPDRPRLIAIGGISGTGKSSVAREIAAHIGAAPGALHLRTDVERKIMQGVALAHRLPAEAYTAESRDEVYRRVFKKAEIVLDGGQSVIVDAVFPENANRALLRGLAQRTDSAFRGFWLEANAAVLRERVAARSAGASDADAGVVESQLETVEPPADWMKVDASGPIAATVAAIMEKL